MFEPEHDNYEIYKDWVKDKDKKFTYEELFSISEPVDENDIKRIKELNQFNVSTYNNYEQIFYDIANSKKHRKNYRKNNLISIAYCILKTLQIFYSIFVCCGSIISIFHFFLFNTIIWSVLLIPCMLFWWLWSLIFDPTFWEYTPDNEAGKINLSYLHNKTSPNQLKGRSFGFSPRLDVTWKKSKIKSSYKIYTANNGKQYLVDLNEGSKCFLMRNWYLIAKYITLGKMKINDLHQYFEDDLFLYLTNENYVKEKLKLWSIFNIDFSLNFMPKYDNLLFKINFIISFVASALIILINVINNFS